MPAIRYALAVIAFLGLSLAQAQPLTFKSSSSQTPLLELYTSEGCSSCPPADRWLAELIRLPETELRVLALAFHVDYWDYIGWKDPFASPAHTDRQRTLARANRQTSIYTPEFLINDREARGSRQMLEKIRQANLKPSPVQLELIADKQPQQLELKLNSIYSENSRLQVEFIVFENNLSNQVDAGENAGHQLTHHQVVRYLSPSLALKPAIQYEIQLKPEWDPQQLGIAVIVRSEDSQFIQSLHGLI